MDGLWSAVGTMNFDNRSLALSEEVMLMVLDEEFGARMSALCPSLLTAAIPPGARQADP